MPSISIPPAFLDGYYGGFTPLNTYGTLGFVPLPAPIITNILVSVDGEVIGAAAGTTISEARHITPMYDMSGTVKNTVPGPSQITGSLGRVRFTRKQVEHAFDGGVVARSTQLVPLDVFIIDSDTAGFETTTTIKNVWVSNKSNCYVTDEWVICDNLDFEAEFVVITDRAVEQKSKLEDVIGKNLDGAALALIERCIRDEMEDLGAGIHNVECTINEANPTIVDISMSVEMPYPATWITLSEQDIIDTSANQAAKSIRAAEDARIFSLLDEMANEAKQKSKDTTPVPVPAFERVYPYPKVDLKTGKVSWVQDPNLSSAPGGLTTTEPMQGFTQAELLTGQAAVDMLKEQMVDVPTDMTTTNDSGIGSAVLLGLATLFGSMLEKAAKPAVEMVRVLPPPIEEQADIQVVEEAKSQVI